MARTWHALSPIARIVAGADMREILAAQSKIKREQDAWLQRPCAADGRYGRDFTIRQLGRKWENLERARQLWLDEFRRTEVAQ